MENEITENSNEPIVENPNEVTEVIPIVETAPGEYPETAPAEETPTGEALPVVDTALAAITPEQYEAQIADLTTKYNDANAFFQNMQTLATQGNSDRIFELMGVAAPKSSPAAPATPLQTFFKNWDINEQGQGEFEDVIDALTSPAFKAKDDQIQALTQKINFLMDREGIREIGILREKNPEFQANERAIADSMAKHPTLSVEEALVLVASRSNSDKANNTAVANYKTSVMKKINGAAKILKPGTQIKANKPIPKFADVGAAARWAAENL